jgi:hypothetical protein
MKIVGRKSTARPTPVRGREAAVSAGNAGRTGQIVRPENVFKNEF